MSQPPDPADGQRDPSGLVGAARDEAKATGVESTPVPPGGGPGERSGDRIDRYELLEEIGEGGMGTVWLARQFEPVKREVALKVIKLGMDTREVVLRFEAERQALALMDHVHIAKVLDGGATESGRPYFVMELVRGTPITDYCDAAKLGLHERLELFIKVCEAIQHAHQKGVIHRDIKPSNVLVSVHDGVAVPKVIDFGIAKATSAELTQKTLFTQYAQILGTPEYMAPEQAEMSGLDIDTRADVYSLGVLLYELLTGTKPFDIRTALDAGYQELLRTIREVDPAKPSTRISTLGEEATPIAANRHVDASTLSSRLRGDLDWIVMKALEKDRTRRYETANGFGADIARFLVQEPVLAAPPGAAYRMRKFVQRRKATVVAIGVIVLLVLAGSVGTGIGLWRSVRANRQLDVALAEKTGALGRETEQRQRAERNEARALQAEAEARAEAERASLAEDEARRRAAELDRVATFQGEQLRQVDPSVMGEHLREALIESASQERRASLAEHLSGLNFTNLSLRILQENLLDQTLEAIDVQFAEQPLVQARLLHVMCENLTGLGLLERATGPGQRALALRRRELGGEHQDTLTSIHNMGYLLMSQGKFAEAEPFVREAAEATRRAFGDEHVGTLSAANLLVGLLFQTGRLAEAEELAREVVETRRRVSGDEHPDTLGAINNLARMLDVQGELAEAELLYREALEGHRRIVGDDDPGTLSMINNLGYLLERQGKMAEAEPYFREALEGHRHALGDEHPDTLVAILSMSYLLQRQGDLAGSDAYLREAIEGFRRVLGDEHPSTVRSLENMGYLLRDQIRAERAADQREALGLHLAELGSLELARGDAAAEGHLGEGFDLLIEVHGQDDWRTMSAMVALGAAVAGQGLFREAEPMLLDGASWMLEEDAVPAGARWLGEDPVSLAARRAADFYGAWERAEPGSGHAAQAARWRERAGELARGR